ncbi:hypothetical protein LXA43DRAFT_1104486 [Ganoderma leucocontextum]|nr:hypothetical protein LXA43DRAFT_1104486 [Ganoderma leucocontextum]
MPSSARTGDLEESSSSPGLAAPSLTGQQSKRPRIGSSPEDDSSPAIPAKAGAVRSAVGHRPQARVPVAPPTKKRKRLPATEFLASDIELIPAPSSDDGVALAPRDQAQADLVEWLRTTDNHSWDEHTTVIKIRRTPKRASRSAKNLLTWIRTVTALMDLGSTDNTAPARAKNKRITATAVGLFINRRAEWVNDCVACRRLYTRHKSNPRFIKALDDISEDTFGISSFRTELGAIVSQILQDSKPGTSSRRPGTSSGRMGSSNGRTGKASKPPYVEIDDEQGESRSDNEDYE